MLFHKPIHMKCGHLADSIAVVPHNNDFADVLACSFCFKDDVSVNQPACSVDTDYQPLRIKRNYTLPILGAVACIMTIILLIVSF